jgi:DNA-binding NtrC family response regulator
VGREKYKPIREFGIGTVETRWRCKHGEVLDVLLSSAPLDPKDWAVGGTFTALNITDRKQTEAELRESVERYRLLFSNVNEAVLVHPLKAIDQPDKFDLVITDMTMPQMLGTSLIKEMLMVRPDLPIILCTGFSERINDEKALAIGARAFIMKPIVMTEIAKVIRNALDGKR